jgi:hypothetical protein
VQIDTNQIGMPDASWVTVFPDTASAGNLPDTLYPLGISTYTDTFNPDVPLFLVPDSVLVRLTGPADTSRVVQPLPNFFHPAVSHGLYGIAQPAGPPMEVLPVSRPVFDFYFFVVLLGLIIMAHTRFLYSRRLRQVALAVFRERNMNAMVREGHLPGERISIGLFVLYLTQVSLMVFILNSRMLHLKFPYSDSFSGYLIIMMAVTSLWIIKWAIIRIISVIFKTDDITQLYQVNLLAFNFMSGVILLALSIPVIYLDSGSLVLVYAGIFSFLMLYRLFRNAGIGIAEKQYSFFYLLIYLSSVELLLPAVLIKIALLLSKGMTI